MTAKPQLRAVVYDRESKGSLASIGSQHSSNQGIIDTYGYDLVGMFADKVGASRQTTKVRKGYPDLLAVLADRGADVVVTTEPSRLDRNLERWVPFVNRCLDNGVQVHLSGEDDLLDPRKPSHWKRLIDAGVAAQMETETLSNRVKRGVATAAVNGGFHGHAPYGYVRVITGEKVVPSGDRMIKKPIKEQRPDEDRAKIVEEIIQRIARRDSINAITADLATRGVPSPEGRRWDRHTVRKIALNVAYIGQRQHLGEVYQGTWPALVSEEDFRNAGKVLREPDRVKTKPGKLKHLLSYLALGTCGGRLHYMPARAGRPDRYHCVVDGCATIAAEHADTYVIDVAVARLMQPDAREQLVVVVDDEPARQAGLEKALLLAKLDEARESFYRIDGKGISAASLADAERRLLPLIEAAEKRSISTTAPVALLDLLKAAEKGEEHVRPLWDTLPMPARRDVLKLLFEEIRVGKLTRRLTRVSTFMQRYEAAAERINAPWRVYATAS